MKSQAPKKSTARKWVVELRDAETLPDLRSIRPEFLIGTALTAVFALMLWFLISGVLELSTLKAETERQVEVNAAAQTKLRGLQQLQKAFQDEDALLTVVAKLQNSHVDALAIVATIAKHLPKTCVLDTIECTPELLIIRGSNAGVSDEAADIINNYIAALNAEKLFAEKFGAGKLTNATRDVELAVFSFDITFPKKPNQ